MEISPATPHHSRSRQSSTLSSTPVAASSTGVLSDSTNISGINLLVGENAERLVTHDEFLILKRNQEKILARFDEELQCKGKRRGAIQTDLSCSAEVREHYRSLRNVRGDDNMWEFDKRFMDEENATITDMLMNEIMQNNPDKWSKKVIQFHCQKYYKSQRDSDRRTQLNGLERHKLQNKRNQRLNKKLDSRLKALGTIEWSERKKLKVNEVMTREYVSSEESEDDDEVTGGPRPRKVRKLLWESEKLIKYKKDLDRHNINSLRDTTLRQMAKVRRDENTISRRAKPKKAPTWVFSM